MINEMKKMSLIALRGDEEKLLHDLLWLSSVEVDKNNLTSDSIISSYDCSKELTRVEDNILTLEQALKILSPMRKDKKKLLSPKPEISKHVFENMDDSVKDAIDKAYKTIFLLKEKESNKVEIQKLDLYDKSVALWLDYQLPLGFEGTATTICKCGMFPINCKLDELILKSNEITNGAFYLETINKKDMIYVSSVYHKKYRREVEELFNNYGFVPNNFKVSAKTADEEHSICSRKIEMLWNRQFQIDVIFKDLASYCKDMELAYDICLTKREYLQNKEKLILTGHTFIITGWVGADKTKKLEKKLGKYKCFCDLSDPQEGDDVPVELKNNIIGSPFEMIVGMYAYPKYGSFDPSFWTAIFFAIMIGVIFADAGYGLLFTIATLIYLKKAKPKGKTKQTVLMVLYCGICCVIAGVLFGGYFGDLPAQIAVNFFNSHALDHLEIICSPTNDPITFIIIAIAIGALHLMTGMIIKMVMDFRRGDWKSAIFDTGSYLVLFLGIGIFAVFNTTIGLGIATFGALIIILFKGRDKKNIFSRLISGFVGLYDLINYASDLLSYSRLFALALSGAVIAQVVNTLATIGGPSAFGIVLCILIIPFGHVLNIGLSAIGAFVHTLRLQYLEFYGKFFIEGGRKFSPIEPKLKYVSLSEMDE